MKLEVTRLAEVVETFYVTISPDLSEESLEEAWDRIDQDLLETQAIPFCGNTGGPMKDPDTASGEVELEDGTIVKYEVHYSWDFTSEGIYDTEITIER